MATHCYKPKINKLQMVKKSAARVVTIPCKSDRLSIASVRMELHWLPVEARIVYKILILAWQAIDKHNPACLAG